MKRTSSPPETDLLIEAIGRKREVLGVTQTELARRIGCTRQMIGLIESGRASPPLRRLRQILDALDLDLRVVWKDRE